MAKQHLILVVTALMASMVYAASAETTTSANTTLDATGTAYDVLQQNNLPQGLLPLGVQSYALHAGGALEVTLPGECNFFVTVAGKRFKFRYASKVSGVIKSGSISSVSGVRFQAGFAWLGFNQVTRDGNNLNIQFEKSTQSFPVSAFAQSPRCN
ncbi:hypothetical protein BAE44_0000199 [Dichanthelium oligosanthes]|uniref:Uncharacterized protein n=1 Tax=Dichanthelium oligosanthes TaxID=888268 RepID=A0A1E5WN16_9POAL|nr:hypothetical protein BAE44_0000199 [Dichanthelium oligosanthes]